ncbi:MAG: glycosyltransferase [Luteitalea sp.]|nr:glycosyltransferase [Luteitalea sp.]
MCELDGLGISFVVGTLGQGGAERQLYYVLKALKSSGSRLRVLCLTKGEFWEEPIRGLGVPVTWVGQSPSRPVRLLRVIAALRAHRSAVLQSHHFYTNLYAVAAARTLGMREIGALRSDAFSEVRESGRVLGRLSLTAPRVVVANSRNAVRNACTLGVPASRLHVLPNVVDPLQFAPGGTRPGGPVRLLAAGRLGPEKRFDRLLTAVARARARTRRPLQLTIVGDGPERSRLEQQARQLGLMPDVVNFTGAVASSAPVYRDADMLVLTSAWEGTPNVILEAMASGLPVVATNVGGVAEVVDHEKTGLLSPAGDDQTLCDAIVRLADDTTLRLTMGREARERILSRHTPEQLPRRLASIYEAVLA